MVILLNPKGGEVIIKIRECFVVLSEHNRNLIPGPIELMLPSTQHVAELVSELQSFLAAASKVETPRMIDHAA